MKKFFYLIATVILIGVLFLIGLLYKKEKEFSSVEDYLFVFFSCKTDDCYSSMLDDSFLKGLSDEDKERVLMSFPREYGRLLKVESLSGELFSSGEGVKIGSFKGLGSFDKGMIVFTVSLIQDEKGFRLLGIKGGRRGGGR